MSLFSYIVPLLTLYVWEFTHKNTLRHYDLNIQQRIAYFNLRFCQLLQLEDFQIYHQHTISSIEFRKLEAENEAQQQPDWQLQKQESKITVQKHI